MASWLPVRTAADHYDSTRSATAQGRGNQGQRMGAPHRSTRLRGARSPGVQLRRCPARRAGHCGGRASAAMCPSAPQRGAPRGCAAPLARRARQRLAPTRWAELPGRVPAGQGSAERPILSGGRRCLTPRPATAGKPDRGRSSCRGRVIHTGTFVGVHVATLPGAAPVDGSRASLAPRAHQPVPTASPCRLLTASPLGEPRRLSG